MGREAQIQQNSHCRRRHNIQAAAAIVHQLAAASSLCHKCTLAAAPASVSSERMLIGSAILWPAGKNSDGSFASWELNCNKTNKVAIQSFHQTATAAAAEYFVQYEYLISGKCDRIFRARFQNSGQQRTFWKLSLCEPDKTLFFLKKKKKSIFIKFSWTSADRASLCSRRTKKIK